MIIIRAGCNYPEELIKLAFVDGGKNSPAVDRGGPPGDAIKPCYMPLSWYNQPGSTMTNTWNSRNNSGSIVAYDQPGAVGAHRTTQFELEMRVMKLLYLLFLLASTSCNQENKQGHQVSLIDNTDSLPIKISYQSLKEKCSIYVEEFKLQKKFSIDESIDIVRAYNTIGLNRLREKDSVFVKYDELFFKNYLNDIAKQFEATVSRGLGYHSKKYDLDIGGAAPNANSFFKIE